MFKQMNELRREALVSGVQRPAVAKESAGIGSFWEELTERSIMFGEVWTSRRFTVLISLQVVTASPDTFDRIVYVTTVSISA